MTQDGDMVLCTVERIDNTTVFVRLETGEQGTIITSEIAPGRIRNIRDYVSPGRKIVCKVLRADTNNIYLSLRRVTPKEKKEVLEKDEKEKSSLGILRSVLGEKSREVAEKIKKTNPSISEFLNNCKSSPKEMESFMPKSEADKICKILLDKKEKLVEVKREFKLSSKKPDGIKLTKEILSSSKEKCDASYISAGHFVIKTKAKDYKEANSSINSALELIGKKAKENKMDFEEGK